MIYRGPGFLAVVWFFSTFPTSHVVSHSQSCVSPVELTDGRGGGGEEPNNTTPKKPGPLQTIQYFLRTIHVKDKKGLDMIGVFLPTGQETSWRVMSLSRPTPPARCWSSRSHSERLTSRWVRTPCTYTVNRTTIGDVCTWTLVLYSWVTDSSLCWRVRISVSDPHWFQHGSRSLMRIQLWARIQGATSMRIRI